MESSMLRKQMPVTALADPAIVVPAIWASFAKLDPRLLIKNPVMFVVEIVAALTTIIFVRDLFTAAPIWASRSRSRCGCGSRCCLPRSRKPSLKAVARRRPGRCARRAPRRRPSC
jgi:hypothetical protein